MKQSRKMMIWVFAVLFGMQIANAANDVVLVEPGPIAYPAQYSYTPAEIQKAITTGALRHQWRIESQKPGTIRLILDGRNDKAVLVVDVVYDDKSYSIKYVRSEGLRYIQGSSAPATVANPNSNTVSRFSYEQRDSTIHSSYKRWMKILTGSIDEQLRIAKI